MRHRADARAVAFDTNEATAGKGALVSCTVAVILLLSCLVSPANGESYPKLANIYFGSLEEADLGLLARWDLLVLGKRAVDIQPEELQELKALSPETKLLAHAAVGYNRDYDYPPINADLSSVITANNWWMRDTRGNRVVLNDGSYLLNMTTDCPRDSKGRRLCDWLAEYYTERLVDTGLWDGLFLDYCMDRIAWVNNSVDAPIDCNGDGIPEGRIELNESWRAGMEECVSRLRELVGDDVILTTNGNNTLYDLCDGDTREDFPEMHGGWYENITHEEHGYLAFEAKYRDPAVNIINTIWDGGGSVTAPDRDTEFDREFLLGLASTLVFGNGYFSCDGPAHGELWWLEYYDIDLGQPKGRCMDVEATPGDEAWWVDLIELIKCRKFERGIALVNPSYMDHTIELGGAYYEVHSWNGRFYEYSGLKTQAHVRAYSGEVLVGTGRALQQMDDSPDISLTRAGMELSWSEVAGADSYSVYRAVEEPDGFFGEEELLAVVSKAYYVDENLEGAERFRYYVAPIDGARCEGQQSRAVEMSTKPGSDLTTGLRIDDDGGLLAYRPSGGEEASGSRGFCETASDATVGLSCAPQPAAVSTTISFSVADDERWGASGRTTITIYDVAGRVVRRLLDEILPAGEHSVAWDLRSDDGRAVASGCYMCVAEIEGARTTAKTLVLR